VPELLPRFHASVERITDQRKIAQAILEADSAPPDSDGRVLRRAADGHNPDRLRGLPAIGRNVSGATVHTDPVKALLRKEARG
jgi:hypothetical protein